ncbi:hypothetical protein ACFSJU_11390 [Paradesertivirga mongoliensis]|uniref:Uncharacterized protein n=1 Tax=Paradesertivirga mongoliensis TaxID=2100740 RepID=A0ABW4ZLP3_9SPHI|nr:hypothetical protein [Pedobacter mongoliensis]
MEQVRIISGDSPENVREQIRRDFTENPEVFDYSAVIEQDGRSITLDVDIDLGGGFEGGYALTRFTSGLKSFDDLHFSIHHQGLLDGIGKLFGIQDVDLGYPEFDRKIVIKTNHPDRLKEIFSDTQVRGTIRSLPEFTFHIGHHHSANTHVESAFLELRIDEAITEPDRLYEIYKAFSVVLDKLEFEAGSIMKHL